MVLDFIISMNHAIPAEVNLGHFMTQGKFMIIDKTFNSQSAVVFQAGEFNKVNEMTSRFLEKVSFFSYDNISTAIRAAHIVVERIPATPFNAVT